MREYFKADHEGEEAISIGIDKGNPITGSFDIVWVNLFGNIAPKLESFDDSWEVLLEFKDLLEKLPTMTHMNRNEFCEVLDELGIIEKTFE